MRDLNHRIYAALVAALVTLTVMTAAFGVLTVGISAHVTDLQSRMRDAEAQIARMERERMDEQATGLRNHRVTSITTRAMPSLWFYDGPVGMDGRPARRP